MLGLVTPQNNVLCMMYIYIELCGFKNNEKMFKIIKYSKILNMLIYNILIIVHH